MSAVLALALLLAPPAPLQAQAGPKDEPRSWTIHGATVYTAAGDPLEDGVVVVEDGKIRSVTGGGRRKDGEQSISAFAVTPGMVDLSARIVPGISAVEQSREIAPEVDVYLALDPFDPRWTRLARSGVTTALVNPPDQNVIGGLGVALKTSGGDGRAGRVLEREVVLRGAFGSQPSQRNHPPFGRPEDFYSRRPTTRMGVEWEHRKAFYDAAASRRDEERAFPGSERLVQVLDGELPFMLQTWSTQDIRTAIYLKEELEREQLGRPRMILDAAAEAWKEPQLLVRSGVAVVLPPFPAQGRTGENSFMAHDTARMLHAQNVPFALSAHGSGDLGASLGRQAGHAMRGGLPFDAALAAVTLAPARMLGLDDRVGSLEAGKDADLVLWSGPPFEASSAVVGVLVDGRLVLDPRAAAPGSTSAPAAAAR